MRLGRWPHFCCLAGAVIGTSAAAEITSEQAIGIAGPDDEQAIVVTAAPDPEPRNDAVRQQARAITSAGNMHNEPLALFQQKICPGVAGLPNELAMLVADRIRFNAERVGLSLATGGECSPNLVVVFVKDGNAFVHNLAKTEGNILTRIPMEERGDVLRQTGPVRTWTVTSLRTRDGMAVTFDQKTRYYTLNTQSANSLFLLPSRTEIELAVVVIDVAAIDGLGAVQLADYATMRGLAKTRPVEGDASYGTILNLFDPEAAHSRELTTFDVAYLKTIYSNQPNIAAAAKIGGVKSAMRKELALAEEEDAADRP